MIMSRRLTTPLFLIAILFGLVLWGRASEAQTTTTNLTSVNIVAVNATNATFTFTYSSSLAPTDLRYTINYGPTTKYNGSLSNQSVIAGSNAVAISGLAPGTTYHFNIQLLSNNTEQAVSADRTFTTPRETSSSTEIVIDKINVDCVDRSCTIFYATNMDAKVDAKWTTADNFSYDDSGLPISSETTSATGLRSMRIPLAAQTPLTANTKYYYRLHATVTSGLLLGAVTTTGKLSFTTSANSTDHLFATGKCSDGGNSAKTANIGDCLGNQYCATAGTLVSDCSKCGYSCTGATTCRPGSPVALCTNDKPLTGAATQCNDSSCYTASGKFKPASAKCYTSWPRCNANTIIKVRPDRGCNLWLSCATSIQTDASAAGPSENLCLNLGACNSLNTKGQCNHYLPLGQCSNDALRFCNQDEECQAGGTCINPDSDKPTVAIQPLTYQTPKEVSKIANLSGNVIAGLDWGSIGGSNVVQGAFPWQLMQQVGGDAQIKNGDLEYQSPNITPWNTVPDATPDNAIRSDFEERNSGPNHVLVVDPITQISDSKLHCSNLPTKSCTVATVNADCGAGTPACINTGNGLHCSNLPSKRCVNTKESIATQCGTTPVTPTCGSSVVPVEFSGAATNSFTANPSELYYAEARIRAISGNPVVRMQFGYLGYNNFTVPSVDAQGKATTLPTSVDVQVTAAWQRVTLGPLKGMSGDTKLAFVCADSTFCSTFQVDDVIVKPVLQVDANPSYITPSCRLYPKSDSPSCDYADTNGVIYKGWKGYCLEHDSQTGTCLSWWPVDIIKGESNIFGSNQTAGYQNRSPLYLCAQAAGNNKGGPFSSQPYTVSEEFDTETQACNPIGNDCNKTSGNNGNPGALFRGDYTIAQCNDARPEVCTLPNSGNFNGAHNRTAVLSTTIRESEIASVTWKSSGGEIDRNPTFEFVNNLLFFQSNATNPSLSGSVENEGRVTFKMYRDTTDPNYIFWRYISAMPDPAKTENLNLNAVTAYMKFDKITGLFLEYGLSMWDATGIFTNGAAYQVLFNMKESCDSIVQVVNPAGNNQAFANRVNSSSYQVPDLNYSSKTDLSPFGGALGSRESDNPIDWPLLPISPADYVNFDPLGQARGGAPYACNGKCDQTVCSVDSGNDCSNSEKIRACQTKDVTDDGVPDGVCVGVSSAPASAKGNQSFQPNATATDLSDPKYFAQSHIMRLFAQSYGIWTFKNGKYGQVPNSDKDNIDKAINKGLFVGWKPPNEICQNNPAANGNVCSSTTLSCTASLAVKTTAAVTSGGGTTAESAARDSATTAAYAKCGLNVDNTPRSTCTDTVTTNAKNGTVCTSNAQCYPDDGTAATNPNARCAPDSIVACDGKSTACPGVAGQYEAGTTARYTKFILDKPCSLKGGEMICEGRCTSGAAYTSAGPSSAAKAPKLVRPPYIAGSTADYCAIPPSVSHVKFVSGDSFTATIAGGSGNVAIKFNTDADPEQLPLSIIGIDWGDKVDYFSYPYAPRNDPAQPHIFSHTYVVNRADKYCKPFGGRTACEYPIRIQVLDNWNWANDAKRDDATSTGPNGVADTQKQAEGTWIKTGLTVIVQP